MVTLRLCCEWQAALVEFDVVLLSAIVESFKARELTRRSERERPYHGAVS